MSDIQTWCRIQETDKGQVLFWFETDSEGPEDEHKLHQMFRHDGLKFDLCVGGWKEPLTQEQFDQRTTLDVANTVVEKLMVLMGDL